MRPSGAKLPFFCVHGFQAYGFLPRYLGPDQPLYGLVQGLDGRRLHTKIEMIAAHYLIELRTVQPEGPYFLGGHSVGGLIAFEIAQQLRRQGQVALLFLIDPSTPIKGKLSKQESPTVSRLSGRATRAWFEWRVPGPLPTMAHVREWLRKGTATIKNIAKKIMCEIYLRMDRPLPYALRIFYMLEVMYGMIYPAAVRSYVPQVYSGRVILLQTEKRLTYRATWRNLAAGGLEIHELPGGHNDMLSEPLVGVVAGRLKTCLDEAQALRKPARRGETFASPEVVR